MPPSSRLRRCSLRRSFASLSLKDLSSGATTSASECAYSLISTVSSPNSSHCSSANLDADQSWLPSLHDQQVTLQISSSPLPCFLELVVGAAMLQLMCHDKLPKGFDTSFRALLPMLVVSLFPSLCSLLLKQPSTRRVKQDLSEGAGRGLAGAHNEKPRASSRAVSSLTDDEEDSLPDTIEECQDDSTQSGNEITSGKTAFEWGYFESLDDDLQKKDMSFVLTMMLGRRHSSPSYSFSASSASGLETLPELDEEDVEQ